jgi:hypothetical protein
MSERRVNPEKKWFTPLTPLKRKEEGEKEPDVKIRKNSLHDLKDPPKLMEMTKEMRVEVVPLILLVIDQINLMIL